MRPPSSSSHHHDRKNRASHWPKKRHRPSSITPLFYNSLTLSVIFVALFCEIQLTSSFTTMTILSSSADLRLQQRSPSPPLPGAILSNPNMTKLYMSASCPELKAESVISSDEDEDERFEPLMESHDENYEAALSALSMDDSAPITMEAIVDDDLPLPRPTMDVAEPAIIESSSSSSSDHSNRRKLQWEFKGLTLWLELEEFNNDISRAVENFSSRHSSPFIPKSHTTAIYGMEHLTVQEAKDRLAKVKECMVGGQWPSFAKPTGITSDIAVCGRPGQVCSIAWSELTLSTSPQHEAALDALYHLFYTHSSIDEVPLRDGPWKPHNSIAYDNPETNALSLLDTVLYASENPTLLGCERRVEAISLWSTEGKMEEWTCLDRVKFW